jgi:hypothetical protein
VRIEAIISEIEPLGSPRTKKCYMSEGAVEPLFGMTIKALKPIAKKLMTREDCQQVAYDLFDTGNYDLMYLAGMIVNPDEMSEAKYHDWISKSYFYMISDFIVSICLSEASMAEAVSDQWIQSGVDVRMSAGYLTYCWRLASLKDTFFSKEKLESILSVIEKRIHTQPNRTRYAMYYFVYNVGVSFLPLHKEALEIAKSIGTITVFDAKGQEQSYHAQAAIEKEVDRGRLGF